MELGFIIIPLLPLIGIALARFSMYHQWHDRYTHKCGYHDQLLGRIRCRVCPKCGEAVTPADFEIWTARALFPLGWQWGKQVANTEA